MPDLFPALVCVGNLTTDVAVQADGSSEAAPGGDALFAALAARLHLPAVTVLAPSSTELTDELESAIALTGTDPLSLPQRQLPIVRNDVRYAENGSRRWTLVYGEEHFEAMSVHPGDLRPGHLGADGILVCGMGIDSQVELAPWLRKHTAATIYLDLHEDEVLQDRGGMLGIIPHCDVFLPSEVEATSLAGGTDLDAAARLFTELGPRTVVIKLAERGCLVFCTDGPSAGRLIEVPAEPVAPVDSTGAGDAFCGAFAAVHLATGDPFRAARAGNAAARIAIAEHGIRGLVDAVANETVATGILATETAADAHRSRA